MVSGLVLIVTAWCVRLRGPLYAMVFSPLSLVIVAIFASMMLDENLYVGRYALRSFHIFVHHYLIQMTL